MTDDGSAPPQRAARLYDEAFCPPEARPLILTAAVLATSLGFIDGTVVAIALPAIRESLGATLPQAQWVSNAYMLTLSALVLTGGAFGDRFGLARVFTAGISVFIAASLVSAMAPSAEVLIPSRAMQGIGAAFMVPGSLAIISRAYPREIRGRAIGIWAAAVAFTTAMGPLIGGLALTFGGPGMWRVIFAINLPLGLLAIWLLLTRVQTDRRTPDTKIDLRGAALATLGLGAVAWALTGAEDGGEALRNAPLFFAIGAASLGLFVWSQHVSDHPMVPLELFRSPIFAAGNLATFLLYFTLSAIMFYLPMTVIAGWGVSEIEAAMAFAPLSVFLLVVSTHAGMLADRVGPGPMITAGALLVALGYSALALTVPAQEFWRYTLPSMAVMGFGMSLLVAPLSTAVMGAVPEESSGAASGINNAMSRIAGLIAVAAMGRVTAGGYREAGGMASFGIPSDTPGHAAAMDAAFAQVAWWAAGLALAAALVALVGIGRRRR